MLYLAIVKQNMMSLSLLAGRRVRIILLRIMLLSTKIFESRHEISNNVVCATSKGSYQPAHTHSLIRAIASRLNII